MLLFTVVMASIPTPTTSKQSIAMASPSPRMDEEDEIGFETDLSTRNMDIEINTDTSNWSAANRKKPTTHDRVSYKISAHPWRGSLNQNHNEEKNLSHESPHAQNCLKRGDAEHPAR